MLHRHTGFPNVCCTTFGAVHIMLWFLYWLLWCKFAKFPFNSCLFAENNVNTFFLKFPSKDIRDSFYIQNFKQIFQNQLVSFVYFLSHQFHIYGNVILSTIFIEKSFAMNVSFRNSSSSLLSLQIMISVHKSHALKISV